MSRLVHPIDQTDHIDGRSDASVTLIEYGDYQCPYCGEAYPVLKQVVRALGGRIRFVFRNFPLSEIHADAWRAAQFAEAAASIGQFWPAHDLLYENQDALGEEDLYRYAPMVGLPHAVLKEAFGGRFDEKIARDFNDGIRSGVNGTPSLFINGSRYDGPRDAESIAEVLEMALENQPAL